MQFLLFINIACPCASKKFVSANCRIVIRLHGNGGVERRKSIAVKQHVAIHAPEQLPSTCALKRSAVTVEIFYGKLHGRV